MYTEAVLIEDRLRTALSGQKLQADKADRAEALLSRLVSPVRVAVLGRRGAGKSGVVNLLAGGEIVQPGVTLPTTQISWGPSDETTCTYADKTRRSFGAAALAEVATSQPIFLALERNLPALRKIALLEVVMDGSPAAQARALAWAAARCDLAVWCTRDFDAVEQALWAAMPTALKKHAILALTHLEAHKSEQALGEHMAQVRAASAGDFHCALPIDLKTAVKAVDFGPAPNADLLRASGASALADAVFDKVNAGYARVREAAESLLDEAVLSAARALREPSPVPYTQSTPVQRAAPMPLQPAAETGAAAEAPAAAPKTVSTDIGYVPPTYVPPTPQQTPRTTIHDPANPAPRHSVRNPHEAAPIPVPEDTPRAEADTPTAPHEPTVQPHHAVEAPVVSDQETPRAEAPPHAEAAPQRPLLSDEGRATVTEAIHYLAKRGQTWGKVAVHNPDAASRQIMEDVLGDAEWLASYLDDPFEDDEALLAPCRDMAADIVDLVQLMEIERTETATVDAVCLLLQAKRRLQALAAAA